MAHSESNVNKEKEQSHVKLEHIKQCWSSEIFSYLKIMMAKGNNKVQEHEKTVKKILKPRVKKDAVPNPPGRDKVKRKKTRPKKHVPNLLDRIRHPEPQKERNVAHQIKKQPAKNSPRTTASTRVTQPSKREQAEVKQIKSPRYIPILHTNSTWLGWWGSSPALERKKESEIKVLKRLQQCPTETPTERNLVTLKPTVRSITIPSQVPRRAATTTISKAHAHLLGMAQHSRFDIPQAQRLHGGLSALATELQQAPEGSVTVNKIFGAGKGNSVKENTAPGFITGGGESKKVVLQEDVTQFVFTEVSESTEPRFITPKVVALFEDWRPGAPKLDKPPIVDRDHWLAVEIEKQQNLRVAQKLGRRKKQVRYLEGVGEDTPLSKDPSQLTVDYPIREDIPDDIEESARGYAEFLYRPGASWMNLGSASTSLRSFGPPETQVRPKSCEARKTTEEIVLAISTASARRELMRKELSERLRQDLLRKKLLLSQNRAAAKRTQCRCC